MTEPTEKPTDKKMLISPRTGAIADPADGGRSRSPRKVLASRLNAIKTGKKIKHPETLKAIELSPTAKLAGVTHLDRINQLKMAYPLFGASNQKEFIMGVELMLAESLAEIVKKKKEGKNVNNEYRAIAGSFLELHDRIYGKLNVNQNLNVNMEVASHEFVLFRQAVLTVLNRHDPKLIQEITVEVEKEKAKLSSVK